MGVAKVLQQSLAFFKKYVPEYDARSWSRKLVRQRLSQHDVLLI